MYFWTVLCLSCIQSFGPESNFFSSKFFFFFSTHFGVFWRGLPLADYCSYITTAEITGFLMVLVGCSGRNTTSQKCLFMSTGLFSPQVSNGFVRIIVPNSFTYDKLVSFDLGCLFRGRYFFFAAMSNCFVLFLIVLIWWCVESYLRNVLYIWFLLLFLL